MARRKAKSPSRHPDWQSPAEADPPTGFLSKLRAEIPLPDWSPSSHARRTEDGFAIRGELCGVPVTVTVHSKDPLDLMALAYDPSSPMGEFFRPAAERFSRRQPRGRSAKTADLAGAVRSATWRLLMLTRGELRDPPQKRSKWFRALVAAAKREEITLRTSTRPLDPLSAAAYAVARFSGIPWEQQGLRSPIDSGAIDREYFLKHYAPRRGLPSGPQRREDGFRLFIRILERLEGRKFFSARHRPSDHT